MARVCVTKSEMASFEFWSRRLRSKLLRSWLAALVPSILCLIPNLTLAQTTPPGQSQATKSTEGKKDEAERAVARAKAHHFDRVLIIVLENVDYEEAIKNPDLAALAQHGASFTNFHALFHPSYPNYLAMVAGTDYGVHKGGSFLGDRLRDFPDDAAHKTIADRLLAAGLDFKQYAEELPPGNCPWGISKQSVPNNLGNYARRHVPFLSFREIQAKLCDRVIRVDSSRADNFFVRDAKQGLVAYSFYTPNMNHNGHDTTVKEAGTWVRKFLSDRFPE